MYDVVVLWNYELEWIMELGCFKLKLILIFHFSYLNFMSTGTHKGGTGIVRVVVVTGSHAPDNPIKGLGSQHGAKTE